VRRSGVPAGGCVGLSRREAAAAGISDAAQTAPLVSQLRQESFFRAETDPRVLKAFAKWSECMRASGFVYSSPFKPDFNLSAPPTALEIHTAKADVDCKYKTNLLGVTYAVQADVQNAEIRAHAQQLATIQAQVRRQERALAAAGAKYGISA
jgi:hypothetical protein